MGLVAIGPEDFTTLPALLMGNLIAGGRSQTLPMKFGNHDDSGVLFILFSAARDLFNISSMWQLRTDELLFWHTLFQDQRDAFPGLF